MVDYEKMGKRMKYKRQAKNMNQEEIARRVQISPSFYGNIERGNRVPSVDTLVAIANALRLLKLPESVRELLREEKISAGHARALLTLGSEEEMLAVADEIIKKDLSVRQTEALCKKPVRVKTEQKPEKQPSFYKMVELALNESLGRKISVTKNKNREGGVLQIEFYSDEELTELSNLLHKEQEND